MPFSLCVCLPYRLFGWYPVCVAPLDNAACLCGCQVVFDRYACLFALPVYMCVFFLFFRTCVFSPACLYVLFAPLDAWLFA